MENYYNYNYTYYHLVSQIDELKNQHIKSENKITELNNDVTTLYSIIKKLNDKVNHNKNSINASDEQSKENTESTKICSFFNRGYCRSKSSCLFIHPKKHCTITKCTGKGCKNRHIKDCSSWAKTFCKFGKACEYKHDLEKKAKLKIVDLEDSLPEENNKEVLSSINDDSIHEIIKMFGNDESFTSKTNVNLVNNKDLTVFSCEKCEYKTENNHNLKCHMKSCHEESEVLKKQLENDKMNVITSKKRKYENDTATTNKSLNKVSKVNGDDAPTKKEQKFTCEDCDYKTHGKGLLKTHMKTIHKSKITVKS